jgi:fructokinase
MRIGIDLGGTKIEGLALDEGGAEKARLRMDTPREDYDGTIAAIVNVVRRLEAETGATGTVGAGIPGSVRQATGLIKNANSTWLNGRPFQQDLSRAMGREVRVANDANCLAVSEATDGAAAGKQVVFAVILGTGCGGGVAFEGKVHAGPNGVGGEWGHNPLAWARPEELPGPLCYCGQRGCMEMWVSGTGVARDFFDTTRQALTTREIARRDEAGETDAVAAIDRLLDRLGRGLAQVVNILDPDVIVFGGGVSRVARLYRDLPQCIQPYVFGGDFDTPLLPAKFGDSSGVRGAAWLWPQEVQRRHESN